MKKLLLSLVCVAKAVFATEQNQFPAELENPEIVGWVSKRSI